MSWEWAALTAIKGRKSTTKSAGNSTSRSARKDSYALTVTLSSAHRKLLAYLQEAFSGQVVLTAQPLSRLVAVDQSDNPTRAQKRLREQVIDFVVVDAKGKTAWAFYVDTPSDEDNEARQGELALMRRVLATAGIRLLRLKKSVRHLPPPTEWRKKLQATSQSAPHENADTEEIVGWLDDVPVLTKALRFDPDGQLVTETLTPPTATSALQSPSLP
ncbi:DUF2726 domain-containing protein [Ottowia sp.]|uniref:DUF2726 domain-containing protein n=1 Tax=Ottowia sp. TaxID=1898956 RepID=UPI003A869021